MTIDNYKFAGKKAIVRVDFNVPLDENGKITDDTRIRGALPTLKKILADGGALIIMSHMQAERQSEPEVFFEPDCRRRFRKIGRSRKIRSRLRQGR